VFNVRLIHQTCHPHFSFYNVFIEIMIFEVLSFFYRKLSYTYYYSLYKYAIQRVSYVVQITNFFQIKTSRINNCTVNYYGNDVFENVYVICYMYYVPILIAYWL